MTCQTDSAAFLSALFERGESLCFSTAGLDTRTTRDWAQAIGTNFVSINPFRPGAPRRDLNVSVFRNILFEIDGRPLSEQADYFERELALPFTTKVFSGGKSLHYILSLAEPLRSIDEYSRLVKMLYSIADWSDPSNKNPSRFTRLGGVTRRENSSLQEVIEIRPRVTTEQLSMFLAEHESKLIEKELEEKEHLKGFTEVAPSELAPGSRGILTLRTKTFMSEGAKPGERNRSLFFAACDFKNNLYTQEEAMEQLLPAATELCGLSQFEATTAIASAFRTAPIRVRGNI